MNEFILNYEDLYAGKVFLFFFFPSLAILCSLYPKSVCVRIHFCVPLSAIHIYLYLNILIEVRKNNIFFWRMERNLYYFWVPYEPLLDHYGPSLEFLNLLRCLQEMISWLVKETQENLKYEISIAFFKL